MTPEIDIRRVANLMLIQSEEWKGRLFLTVAGKSADLTKCKGAVAVVVAVPHETMIY